MSTRRPTLAQQRRQALCDYLLLVLIVLVGTGLILGWYR